MGTEIIKQEEGNTLPIITRISSAESLAAIAKIDLPKNCSLAEIRKAGSAPICSLTRGKGDNTECYKFIMAMIIYINQYIGVAWSDYQVEEVAKEFYTKHYYWHQLDMKKFVQMCRGMEFDKLLSANQFTPIILMNWADKYDSDWIGVSVEQSMQAHDKATYDGDRRVEMFDAEQVKKIDDKKKDDRIKNMQQIIDNQSERLKKK